MFIEFKDTNLISEIKRIQFVKLVEKGQSGLDEDIVVMELSGLSRNTIRLTMGTKIARELMQMMEDQGI